jgi:uncharacterized membrane protein YfcA
MDGIMGHALLAVAALGAGVLNAIAGGGSFLTFPALVATGVPPIVANATSAMAVAPGYLGSTLGFREEIAAQPRPRLWQEMAVVALGGVCGALLLLVTPSSVFSGLVPWLLGFATLLFALGPRLTAWARGHQAGGAAQSANASRLGAGRAIAIFAVATYGGYFNGGLGILLMAVYLLLGETNLNAVNALKNLNSLVLSVLSVAAFAVAGAIVWPQAVWMMVWATLGGWAGARLARRLPMAWVRAIVIVTGVVMTVLFAMRG